MTGQKKDTHNQRIGRWGEDCAAQHLESAGFTIVGRNVRTPEGEIDLIARQKEMFVFCEVKTRTDASGGYPEEAITDEKFEHMTDSAESYLEKHPEIGDHWRLDVIAVTGKPGDPNPQIEWFENAV